MPLTYSCPPKVAKDQQMNMPKRRSAIFFARTSLGIAFFVVLPASQSHPGISPFWVLSSMTALNVPSWFLSLNLARILARS